MYIYMYKYIYIYMYTYIFMYPLSAETFEPFARCNEITTNV